jgi:hypothetical protein
VLQLVEEPGVAVHVDEQRGVLHGREHPGHEPGDRRFVDVALAGGLAREPLPVEEDPRAALITLVEGAGELALAAFQRSEPLGAVEWPVEEVGELGPLALPLQAGHHPVGRVAVAVAAGAVRAAGAERVARPDPQRQLEAGPHGDAVLVERLVAPGGGQH